MTLHAKQLFFIILCGSRKYPYPHPPPPPGHGRSLEIPRGRGFKGNKYFRGVGRYMGNYFFKAQKHTYVCCFEPMQHSQSDSKNGKQNYYISRNQKQALRKSKIKSTPPSACFALLEWFSCIDDKFHFLFATESRSPCFHDKLHEIKGFARYSNKQTCEWTLFGE